MFYSLLSPYVYLTYNSVTAVSYLDSHDSKKTTVRPNFEMTDHIDGCMTVSLLQNTTGPQLASTVSYTIELRLVLIAEAKF